MADDIDITNEREAGFEALRERLRKERREQLAKQADYSPRDCESCGATIHPERIKAVPHTTLCIECQGYIERLEQRR